MKRNEKMSLELLEIAEELNGIGHRAMTRDLQGGQTLYAEIKRQALHIEGIAGRIRRGEP